MKFGKIILNSFKYPFINLKGLLFVCFLFALNLIFSFGIYLKNEYVMVLGLISTMIVCFILPGYLLSVIKRGCEESSESPKFDIKKNFIDTLNLIVLSIVYDIIPWLIIFVLFMSLGIHFFTGFFNSPANGLNVLFIHFGIILILAVIVMIIFAIFKYIATARLAYYDSLTEALSFKKVFNDIKQIGILKIIGLIILMMILFAIVHGVSIFILSISFVGILLSSCILAPIVSLIFSYSLGLLYSNNSHDYGEIEDLDQFEKEIEYLKYRRIT